MSHAIGIRLRSVTCADSPTASRFFGSPKIPLEWMLNELYESDLFFCQLQLADLAPYDPDGALPHTGYLYVFLQMREHAAPDVRVMYCDGKPDYIAIDFNAEVEGFEHLTKPLIAEFFTVDPDAPCTRLLGTPTVWEDVCEPPRLLLQFDPRELGFKVLPDPNSYLCLFFDPEGKGWDRATARIISKQ